MTYLNARAGLIALVDDRITPLLVEQAETGEVTLPAIAFQLVSGANEHHLSGVSQLARPRMQFSVYGRTYLSMLAVRDALVDALDGYRGMMGTVEVQACLKLDEHDMPGPGNASAGNREARVYGRVLDFNISYTEPVPSYT